MQFIKDLGLGIYYRIRRMKKALSNWRKFGVIIFGSIFLLANIAMPLHLADTAEAGGLTYLYIDPSTLSIEQGKSYQFKYRAEDQNHQPINVSVQWSAYNPAAGSITQTGLFTASQTPGTYNNAVKLSSGALSTYARVIVVQSSGDNGGGNNNGGDNGNVPSPKLTYLYIDPSTLSIGEGKTYQMKYRAEDQNHQPINITSQWSMYNSAAGNIANSGLFTAGNTPGTYNNAIKLSAGVLSTYARVIVVKSSNEIVPPPTTQKLTYLYIDPSTLSIEQGKSYQFKYRAEDQNHQPMNISVQWSAYNPAAGSITQTGLFTASQTPGTYNNAVKLSSGALSTYARVIVYKSIPQIQLNSVAINPTNTTLYVGNQKQFTVTAYDQNGAAITSGVTWQWDVTEAQAGRITQTGLFTADNHPGTYNNVVKVTATYNNVSKSAYASVTVQTTPLPALVLSSVQINPTSARVEVNHQQQFTATAYDQYGHVFSARGVDYSWSVTNAQVGLINQSGLFTAKYFTGNYNNLVKVVASYGGVSKSTYASVEIYDEVISPVLSSVSINPNYTSLYVGNSQQFTAVAYNQFGNILSGVSYTWAVVNGGGWVDQNGNFTAGYQTGTFTNTVRVAASYDAGVTKYAYATVIVNEVINQAVLERVEIIPNSISIRVYNQYDFNAQAYDNNNNPIFNNIIYSWSVISGSGSINQSGLYTAPNYTGNATVQVRASQSGIDRYALATITIYDDYISDEISYVRITPSVTYLNTGSSVDFNAQAYNASGNPVSASYTWDLMNSIGSIDQNGYFTASYNAGTYNDAVRVRAYRNGVERIDYADVIISSSQSNNYGLSATLSGSDENGGTTYEGDIIVYTLQLTNNRNNALTNVTTTFEVPQYTTFVSVSSADGVPSISGRVITWNSGTLYVSNSKTLTMRVRVNSGVPSNAVVSGKAYVWASEINAFWVYANDIYVAGTGAVDYYKGGIPLTNTGAFDWVIAGLAALAGTLLTKKFLLRSLL